MYNKQFIVTDKKRSEIKPFFQVYQAKCKGQNNNSYLAEIYDLSNITKEKVKQAFQYNQCVFSDDFQLSTSNIVKIKKIQESEAFCAHYISKYDKTLQLYLKDNKKGRIPEQSCIQIMQDILKGLATILQAGYRPVSIRANNVVRYFSRNPEQRQQIWKIKNVVYSSNLILDEDHFLTLQGKYAAPEIYNRRNHQQIDYQQSQQYTNAMLVWSLGIIFAKLLGIEGKLDSKKKLLEFRDRQFPLMDILYVRKEYSPEFLKTISSMLHFDNKKRMTLKQLFKQPIFSQSLHKRIKKSSIRIDTIKNAVQKTVQSWDISCSFFNLHRIF